MHNFGQLLALVGLCITYLTASSNELFFWWILETLYLMLHRKIIIIGILESGEIIALVLLLLLVDHLFGLQILRNSLKLGLRAIFDLISLLMALW